MLRLFSFFASLAAFSAAWADSASVDRNVSNAAGEFPIAAVMASFPVDPGKPVRLAVYDSEEAFLEQARSKHEAAVDEKGLAILPLGALEPGEYAFAAYLDLNGDGELNRGKVLGRPKEPVAFSNGVKPALRKPSFSETKVKIEPGSVVVITLED